MLEFGWVEVNYMIAQLLRALDYGKDSRGEDKRVEDATLNMMCSVIWYLMSLW